MDFLLNWVKGIMGCIMVMSLVLQCVPGKAYRPYLRLFMGIILILTVLSPFTELIGLGEALETMVGELAYQEEIPGWDEKLLRGEEWAEKQIVAKAEEMSREAEENQAKNEEKGSESVTEKIEVEVKIDEVKPVSISGGEADEDT